MANEWAAAALTTPSSLDPTVEVGTLRPLRRIDLVAQFSGAFDLAEGQSLGHGARVAHVADAIARRLEIDGLTRDRLRYAALLHDSGVAVRELPEDRDESGGHLAAGAWVAERFGLDAETQQSIRCSHERWDGGGRPNELSMKQIPEASLLIAAAHWVADILAPSENPLRARASLLAARPSELAPVVGERIAGALFEELRDDGVWIALWSSELPSIVAASASPDERPTLESVHAAAEAMGEIVDASIREAGRAVKISRLAGELARRSGIRSLDPEAVAIAGLLLDIGHLGVPRHILQKPAILSIDEMEVMRRHPGWAAQLLEQLPGFSEIATWVEAHHERPDGRGYPEMLERTEIPYASRILALADAYWALRAARPYREALSHREALGLIDDEAGKQFDGDIAALLPDAVEAIEGAEAAA